MCWLCEGRDSAACVICGPPSVAASSELGYAVVRAIESMEHRPLKQEPLRPLRPFRQAQTCGQTSTLVGQAAFDFKTLSSHLDRQLGMGLQQFF